ncbi:MAG: hypothetical protein JXA13_03245 [Anaerolineales bacterium]|nr:hypothetical protein [Anaerolineales bacterium]
MDKSFHRQDTGTQTKYNIQTSMQILDDILDWLFGIFMLTEEEQEAAGIYSDRLEDE